MNRIYAVVGLQYGSEGKGNVVVRMAMDRKPDVAIVNWGPNSGHTGMIGDMKLVNTMLPLSVMSPSIRTIMFGAGALINVESLKDEIEVAKSKGMMEGVHIVIHPQAALVLDRHRTQEAVTMEGIGSTMKGTGSAAVERMARRRDSEANTAGNFRTFLERELGAEVCAEAFADVVSNANNIALEGCQGYSLSMYHGQYPYTTSRDTSMHQLLADCCIPYGTEVDVIGCVRTYPIRVANRYDENGDMVGFSGPCYDDQVEIEWSDIGVETEYTTVTKLPRRIFTFSKQQVKEAVRMNGCNKIALMFADYIDDDTVELYEEFLKECGAELYLVGRGPDALSDLEYARSGNEPIIDYQILGESDGKCD